MTIRNLQILKQKLTHAGIQMTSGLFAQNTVILVCVNLHFKLFVGFY